MLKDWQSKFPRSFERFPNLFTDLESEEQDVLSQVLRAIEQKGLLDENTVGCVLENASYSAELTYLINVMDTLNCFNKPMLCHLLSNHYLPELQDDIETLSSLSLVCSETVTFLFSTQHTRECVDFIIRAHKAGVENVVILNYLSQHVSLGGLSRAMTLFDLSSFSYKQQHFQQFSSLSKVLENPLCQTIFDARLRGFSDYEIISEPLAARDADSIITKLVSLSDQETKIRLFFDFFVPFRPFPASQKYIVTINVAEKVTAELTFYIRSLISAIESQQDYVQAREMISTLRSKGGNKSIFDKIKYDIASAIESEDLCSTRKYEDMMSEIGAVLNQPQVNLDSFADELQNSKGYREYVRSTLTRQSFLTRPVATDGMDIESGKFKTLDF